ncbi:MAG: AsmA-like C-terminal region-containing protein [Planctomycetaceae bacterium]
MLFGSMAAESHDMTFRKTMKWLIAIVVLLGLAGGAYGFYLWNQSDELLRAAVVEKLAEIAPGWDIRVRSARFDWLSRRRVYLNDVEIQTPGHNGPMAVLPEIVLTIDRERLEERQEIDVESVTVRGVRVDLVRDVKGVWNWQSLPPLRKSDKSLPEIQIEDGVIRLQIAQGDGSETAEILLQHANVDLIPSGKREFRVRGSTQLQDAGKLNFDAQWDVDAKTWTASGDIHDVTTSGELISLAASTSPQLRSKLQQADASLRKLAGTSRSDEAVGEGAPTVPDFGVGGTLNVDFQIARSQADASPKFAIAVGIEQGHVTNAALPFPLDDMTGRLLWDNDQLAVRDLTARFGTTVLTIDGRVTRTEQATPARFNVALTDVLLDDRLRDRMPQSWQKIYDSLRPAGPLDVKAVFDYDGVNSAKYEGLVISAKNCTCRHDRFKYPVRGINGTIEQRDWGLELRFTGLAGRRPVSMKGYLKNPGPTVEARFDINVEKLPIDETLLAACKEEQRKPLRAIDLKGFATAHCILTRPPGLDQKYQIAIVADVSEGSLEYERFPWRVNEVKGRVTYDSKGEEWQFLNLEGVHGSSIVTGKGSFTGRSPTHPGLLILDVAANGAHLDSDLEAALGGNLRALWRTLSPTGRLDVVTNMRWVPGNLFEISIPTAEVDEGTLQIKPFPLPLSNVRAKLSYVDGKVGIHSISASHANSRFDVKDGYAVWQPNGDWVVRLKEFYGDDLDPEPNRPLRQAFGSGTAIRGLIDELNPHGSVDLSRSMLELKGTTQQPELMTAAWDLRFVLSGNSLHAGIDLKRIAGNVAVRGTLDSDGNVLLLPGSRVDLDHVEVLGHSLTQVHGPYRLKERQLIVGRGVESAAARQNAVARADASTNPLSAQIVNGTLELDASATLQKEASYRLRMTLEGGNLQEYARQYLTGVKNLQGTMDGWIDLAGRGTSRDNITGKGQLRISRAALYELPVMVQIFKLLSFVPPADNTAFHYAMADFSVARKMFDFKSIDLVGDTIRLRGKGTARFDGILDLEFYSMLPRQSRTIPFIDFVVGEATKGWVGVTVTGHVGSPVAQFRAAPQLDDAMKQFLRAFELPRPGVLPQLLVSPMTAFQRDPAQRPGSYR